MDCGGGVGAYGALGGEKGMPIKRFGESGGGYICANEHRMLGCREFVATNVQYCEAGGSPICMRLSKQPLSLCFWGDSHGEMEDCVNDPMD